MKRVCALLLLLAGASQQSHAEDWPQFLGPERNGLSSETGLIDSFPDGGPQVVWRQPLGVGMSNVAVVKGLVYTMFQDADSQYVVAMKEESGNIVWRSEVGKSYKNAMGNGPRATPTVFADRVFSFTGDGILTCQEASSGRIHWNLNAVRDAGGKPAEYGNASSPLIAGDNVVVQVGGSAGAVAAYDIKTGKRAWAAGRGSAGYSSPVLLPLAGRKQVVAFIGAAVLGIDPADGKVLWTYPYTTAFDCNTSSPVLIDDDVVLISSGENHGSAMLRIASLGGSDGAEVVWSSIGPRSVLRAEWQTPIQYKGHLYGLDNVGSAGTVTNMVCVRVRDGEQVWIERRFGKSNMTFADGKFFASTMKGELVLINASAEGFDEVSRASILEAATRQAPVIANGKLYLRDDNEVVCLNVKASE